MTTIRRFSMEKLVRDKMEDYNNNLGIVSNIRILPKNELIKALKYKLLEEGQEVFSSPDMDNLIEELADVQEVIHSLMNLSGITEEIVEQKRLAKKADLGGFEKGSYFYFVDIPENCPELQYFLERPEKYPEIELVEEASS